MTDDRGEGGRKKEEQREDELKNEDAASEPLTLLERERETPSRVSHLWGGGVVEKWTRTMQGSEESIIILRSVRPPAAQS
jgi:hypothetical protein